MISKPVDRLNELLADRATQGLSVAGQAELDRLLAAHPAVDAAALDQAAASINLAIAPAFEGPLPASLLAKLQLDAATKFRPSLPKMPPARPGIPYRSFAGWAAAAVLLGVVIYLKWPAASVTLGERREFVRAQGVTYRSQPNQPVATVVWSQTLHEGYLEITGLPPNDPSATQYQIWILDSGRADPGRTDKGRHARVSGGTFNVTRSGTAFVPIHAAFMVLCPTGFVVTAESPGGVIEPDPGAKLLAVLAPAL